MNQFEEMVKLLDRRIKRIGENPDPKLLKSTKLLYELERESYIDRLQAWKDGKPHTHLASDTLVTAMGFIPLETTRVGWRIPGTGGSQELFDCLRAAGFPDDGCDIMTMTLAMHVRGGDLPEPAVVIVTNNLCHPAYQCAQAESYLHNTPSFFIDTGLVPTYDNVRYVAGQLGDLIEFAQEKVPGIKYDEDKLIELHEFNRIQRGYLREVYQAKKASPCPIAGLDAFRTVQPVTRFTNPAKGLEWAKAYRDEMIERVEKGFSPVREEKLRFMWLTAGPYMRNPFDYLEERGVTVPQFVTGGLGRRSLGDLRRDDGGDHGDDMQEYGRKLTPLEEEARGLFNLWGSTGNWWVDGIMTCCKDLKIDGIVQWLQVGCPTTLGLQKILSDRAEKELGILTLNLEGRMIDEEAYDRQRDEAKLGEFVDLCLARKGIS